MPQKNIPFTAGPRLTEAPLGDPSREAVASLRGYAYQLYSSALAWFELQANEELYLEVAEDYAIAGANALKAVQVKDTSPTNITINSEGVKETLEAFLYLTERNPDRRVYLRYLSTSAIGLERTKSQRATGVATLNYWREAASFADVAPLRDILLGLDLSPRLLTFIRESDDQTLRENFLKRIHWDCGQPPLKMIEDELAIQIGRYASSNLGISDEEGRQLSGVVIKRVLDAIVGGDVPRRLSCADLQNLLNEVTSVRVPRRVANAFLEASANRIAGQPNQEVVVPRVLESLTDLPLPSVLANRAVAVSNVVALVRNNRVAILTGGTGRGKTVISRLASRAMGGIWHLVDLRDIAPTEVARRLNQANIELPTTGSAGLILDDTNEIDTPIVRQALVRLLSTAKRRDVVCLITAYNRPSLRSCAEIGLAAEAVIPVSDFTEEEVLEIVVAAGGDSGWANTIHVASAFGHPQLVNAIVSGLRSRSWPIVELRGLRRFDKSDDVEAERLSARKHLVQVVPDNAKDLLFRISLIVGRFERQTALSLASIQPEIPTPGLQLDLLIGPWVEQLAHQQLRVSPLLEGAGHEILSPQQEKAIHRAVADAYTSSNVFDLGRANAIFFHGLQGEAEVALTQFVISVLLTEETKRGNIAEWLTALKLHRTDHPIFAKDMYLAILLRVAQILLVVHDGKAERVRACWAALQNELKQVPEKMAHELEAFALGRILCDKTAAATLPDWISLVLRFGHLTKKDRRLHSVARQPVGGMKSPTLLGMFFLIQAQGIQSVAELRAIFDKLDSLSARTRNILLADAAAMPSDFSLFVSLPWSLEHKKGTIDWLDCANQYLGMAQLARKWGIRNLALRCHIARAVMYDEYAHEADSALKALNDAEEILGSDPAISRARAKIFYRRKDHSAALALLRDVAGNTDRVDLVEQAFMFREAAISAAETGDWSQAQEWFDLAQQAASKTTTAGMVVMGAGLLADQGVAAFQAGDTPSGLALLARALRALSSFDASSSDRAEYCHRVVRHAVLCIHLRSTGKAKFVQDQETSIITGMCSNPEPPNLKDLPLGHIDVAWYLLAEAEIFAIGPSVINTAMRDHLKGRSIPPLEVPLREALLERAIRCSQVQDYIAAQDGWIDALLYVHRVGSRMREFSPLKPIYGSIEKATPLEMNSETARFGIADGLLAFGIVAAIQQRQSALKDLSISISKMNLDEMFKKLVACMAGERTDCVDNRLAPEVWKIARAASDLEPDDIFVAAVNMIQHIARSNFKLPLATLLANWLRQRWSLVLAEQTFLLRNPAINCPSIQAALAMNDETLAYCAQLLLTIEPAATTHLSQQLRANLTALSKQK